MKIALVTYQDKGTYNATGVANEDQKLINYLKLRGITLEKQIWNDPNVDWTKYDLAILKSPWDYFDLINDFYKWLDLLQTQNVKLLNPIPIVKWNADKNYLKDIEKAGLNVTPSLLITNGDELNADEYFKIFNTDKFIIKPVVSGGSKNTFKVTAANADEVIAQIKPLLQDEDFIIQPFLKEIEEHGEWSFIFFNGKFSHALLKKAKDGDFRVQPTFGGTIHPQNANADLVAVAETYVNKFAKDCLYARVDGTIIDSEFVLMELELIEPYLFLDSDPNALENYYMALKALI